MTTTVEGSGEPDKNPLSSLTIEQYLVHVKELGLIYSGIGDVYRAGDGTPYNVPDPEKATGAERHRHIERLRIMIRGF